MAIAKTDDGTAIHYDDTLGSDPAVVLVHGITESSETWASIFAAPGAPTPPTGTTSKRWSATSSRSSALREALRRIWWATRSAPHLLGLTLRDAPDEARHPLASAYFGCGTTRM